MAEAVDHSAFAAADKGRLTHGRPADPFRAEDKRIGCE
jgi:hypothetical protein